MAKDITISEDGVAKAFTGVGKLVTRTQGGGTCRWVPEDELGVGTFVDNGTYHAGSFSLDGFEKVVVAIPVADTRQY